MEYTKPSGRVMAEGVVWIRGDGCKKGVPINYIN